MIARFAARLRWLTLAAAAAAGAAQYPERPTRLVVGFPAGGWAKLIKEANIEAEWTA
jgi:tripartite-type tricarboxylate transporter receptor subunit TctC